MSKTNIVLIGMAGAVVPLLRLAEATGDQRWRDEAVQIGHRLAAAAKVSDTGACWPGIHPPGGLGGFAHGALGIGWALARLDAATGQARFADVKKQLAKWLPKVDVPPAKGSRHRVLYRSGDQWIWQGKPIRPEDKVE